MARRADLPDFNQKRVAIAIIIHGLHILEMPRGHALDPVFLARARPEAGLADLQGLAQRIDIQVRHHQDFFRFIILNDRRDQAVGIKLQLV